MFRVCRWFGRRTNINKTGNNALRKHGWCYNSKLPNASGSFHEVLFLISNLLDSSFWTAGFPLVTIFFSET